MRGKHRVAWFGAAVLGLLWLGAEEARASTCEEIFRQIETERSVDAARALYQEALSETNCSRDWLRVIGREVAIAMVREAERRHQAGQSLASLEPMLENSLQYGRLWRVLATLGDLAQARGDFETATRRYQEALANIDDPVETPSEPPQAIIAAIFKKAETTRMLADTYVAAPTNRAGEATGLGALGVRGFKPQKRAVPVTFEFDSAVFDAKGRQAAADLLGQLTQQKSPDITLVGHTDPRGSAAYNMALSRERAEALRAFLLAQGYQGRIVVLYRGESDPYQADDPGRYSQEQLYRLHRRVELVR